MANVRNLQREPMGHYQGPQQSRASTGVLDTAREKAEDLASSAADVAGEAWDGTRQAASAVADAAGNAWGELEGCMKRYPLATFLTGVGVGFGVGVLLTSGMSSMFSGVSLLRGLLGNSSLTHGMGLSGRAGPNHPYGT